MSTPQPCPHCGKPTPMNRLMCLHCGGKLHGPGQQSGGGKSAKAKRGGGLLSKIFGLVRGLVRLVVLLALIAIFGLGLWSVEEPSPAFGKRELLSAEKKIEKLHQSVKAERPDKMVFHEKEINAYLKSLVDENQPAQPAAMTVTIRGLNLDLRQDDMRMLMFSSIGPVTFSWELIFVAEVDSTGFKPVVKSARVGHLPMPGPLVDFVQSRFATVVSELAVERRILGRAKAVEVRNDQVQVQIRGRN